MIETKTKIQSYLYLIKPRREYDVGADMPCFAVIAKNKEECWDYVYNKYGNDQYSIDFLRTNMCIGSKLMLKNQIKSRLVYASMA